MLSVKNKGIGPVEVFCGGKRTPIAPGETLESEDFTEKEEAFVRAYPSAFAVTGKGSADVGGETDTADYAELQEFKSSVAPVANRLNIHDAAIFNQIVMDELDKGDAARRTLGDIVALFDTPEVDEINVKAAVERLLQDLAALSATDTKPSDLAAAVKLLDDANDDHWTQAGKPRVSALTELMGADVSAAEYDRLPDADRRERVKPSA